MKQTGASSREQTSHANAVCAFLFMTALLRSAAEMESRLQHATGILSCCILVQLLHTLGTFLAVLAEQRVT